MIATRGRTCALHAIQQTAFLADGILSSPVPRVLKVAPTRWVAEYVAVIEARHTEVCSFVPFGSPGLITSLGNKNVLKVTFLVRSVTLMLP